MDTFFHDGYYWWLFYFFRWCGNVGHWWSSGWWFGSFFMTFHMLETISHLTFNDFHIFQTGRYTTNQYEFVSFWDIDAGSWPENCPRPRGKDTLGAALLFPTCYGFESWITLDSSPASIQILPSLRFDWSISSPKKLCLNVWNPHFSHGQVTINWGPIFCYVGDKQKKHIVS